MTHRFVLILTFLFASSGCGVRVHGPDEATEWAAHTSIDMGTICVTTAQEDEQAVDAAMSAHPQTFAADTPLRVVHGICFRTDCERNVEVSLEAEGLNFTTRAELEAAVPEEGLGCNDDCELHLAILELDPLPEGEHTITFAGETKTVTVPGVQRACVGAFPFGANRDWYYD